MSTDYEEYNRKYQGKETDLLGGIYRVVKSIDGKVEGILDALEESLGTRFDDEDFRPHFLDEDYENGY